MAASDSTFAAAIDKIEHAERLKESLRAMLAGQHLPKAHAHGMLEGDAAPELRIQLAVELAKAIKAEDPQALFAWLNDKDLGVKGLKEVAHLLTPPTRTATITNRLSFIDISDNALTAYGEEVGPLRDLCFQLAKLTSLKVLSLHNNTLRFDGSSIVAKLLRLSKSLRFLDLSRCQVGDRGAQALFAAFVPDDDFNPDDMAEEDRGGALPGGSTEAMTARRASQLAATGGLGDAAATAASGTEAEAGTSARRPSMGGAADDKGVNPLADPRLAAIHALNPAPHAKASPAAAAGAPGGEAAGAGAGGAGLPPAGASSRPGSAGLKRPGSAGVRPGSASSRRAQAALGIVGRAGVESSNTTLTHLDLSSNNLAGASESSCYLSFSHCACVLASYLLCFFPSVLIYHHQSGYDNPMPCAKLVRALGEHPSLVWLNLSRNRFTRSIIGQLIAGLETNRSLRTLILESDNIDAQPATRLAEILATHPALEVLNLRFNSVRSDGAIAFAKVLRASTQPYAQAVAQEILASAGSGKAPAVDADGIAIDESTGSSGTSLSFAGSRLRSLDLRSNFIGQIGTRAVLEALGVVFPASMPAEGGAGAALAAAEAQRHEEEKAAAAAEAQKKSGRPSSASRDEHHDEPDSQAGSGVVLAGSGSRALLALKKQQRKAALRALGLGVTGTIAEEDESAIEAAEGGEEKETSTVETSGGHETKVTTSVSVTSDGDIIQLVTVTVTIHPHQPPAAAGGAGAHGKPPAKHHGHAHGHAAPAPSPRVISRSFSRVVRMDGDVVSKVMADRLAHLEMDKESGGATTA
jgi:Leucine Rich repeat